ncbi:hypothetical protein AVEN_191883-1 [Araneus ventricosus]|uniref:Uncharacterized protein n=1 Tax=Araneus ventricosus TaxID=182803 RepID=A0A4Y2JBX6_ARAVE|nr:hypothetical protein AVEN_191883-1 [Araneus ventricosus]
MDENQHIVTKIIRWVYCDNSPTNRIMEKDVLFKEYSRKQEAQTTKKAVLVQRNIRRQQITNNNRNSTNNSAQRLTADQVALRTRLQRVTSYGMLQKNPDLGSYMR